jgi:hypothetical protein
MRKLKSLKTLSQVIFASAIFDIVGGIYFMVLVGESRTITTPATHNFYAILLGMFLLCFAYLQILIAQDIRRYFKLIGAALLSRVSYVVLFSYYFINVEEGMVTFLPTAIADALWVILIVTLVAFNNEFSFKDLILKRE